MQIIKWYNWCFDALSHSLFLLNYSEFSAFMFTVKKYIYNITLNIEAYYTSKFCILKNCKFYYIFFHFQFFVCINFMKKMDNCTNMFKNVLYKKVTL